MCERAPQRLKEGARGGTMGSPAPNAKDVRFLDV